MSRMTKDEAIQVLLADGGPIVAVEQVLLAAKCTNFVIAGRTPCGNGFSLTNRTDGFVRGMVRKAMKADIDRENYEARKVEDEELSREDAWFEQRSVPR